MQKGGMWIIKTIVLVTVLYAVVPQEKLDKAHESWLRLTSDAGQACLDYERRALKDADSARVLEVVSKSADDVRIMYKAKNSYGAYSTSEAHCAMSKGKVDANRSEIIQEIDRVNASNAKRRQRIVCMDRLLALLEKDRTTSEGQGRDQVRQTEGCSEFQ